MINNLKIKARFDRRIHSTADFASHYLLIDIQAPESDKSKPEVGSPLNLALVIDSSGSMSGERLEFAKQAAAGVVERLTRSDRISLISFDETAEVHVDGIICDEAGKQATLNAIKAIRTGSSTNLSEGWQKGAECLQVVMKEYPHMQNTVLLLSDGHANRGVMNPVALAQDAAKLQTKRISSSAVGIGYDYSTTQLMAIAVYGGGTLHHAPAPQEIIEVVMGELEDLRARSIENVSVSVDIPQGARVELFGLSPCEFNGSQMKCFLGGIVAGATRSMLLRIQAPQEIRSNMLEFKIGANYRLPGSEQLVEASPEIARLEVVSGEQCSNYLVDSEAGAEIAGLWQAYVVFKVADLNRANDFDQVKRFLETELAAFKQYCSRVPEALTVMKDLEELAQLALKNWNEAQRKEIQYSSYLASQRQQDKRSRGSQDWRQQLPSGN